MKKRLYLFSLALVALSMQAKTNDDILSHTITDESIVFPESFEADTQKLLESWYMKNYTATDSKSLSREDPKVSDAEYKRRLSAMPCVIEMPYNQIVRSYIERYTKKGRAQVSAILGLGLYYIPIFEQALEAEGLPLELKYLPVIESGLDPNAVSRHGATGLWQFMLGPAKGLGMEVNSLVDERRDPYTSSRFAAKFLKDLYSTYGDWSLAIAAYNCGPGTVNKAIRRAGGDPKSHDFWSIYYYLPAETRGYVPMFIAANYVMTYYPEHHISPVLPTKPLVTDTIGINNRVHFEQISKVLNIPKDELRLLNPQFRADLIPGSPEKQYALILPGQQVHAYLVSEPQILSYEADKYKQREEAIPGGDPSGADAVTDDIPAEENLFAVNDINEASPSPVAQTVKSASAKGQKRSVVHTVAAGESLADIAKLYEVDITEVRRANSLRRNAVRPGQQLRIETSVAESVVAQSKKNVRESQASEPVNGNETVQETASTRSGVKAATPRAAASKTPQTDNTRPYTSGKGKKKQTTPKQKEVKHEVKEGDNLSKIAKRYGVSVEDLKKANAGKGDMIHPGDNITIPSKGKSGSSKKGSGKSSSKKGKKRRR